MNKWVRLSKSTLVYDEPLLCLLNNGQQIILAFDKSKCEWVMYDEQTLEDAYVVAWKGLESKEEIENELREIAKFKEPLRTSWKH